MDVTELVNQRERIKSLISEYARRKHDATILVKEYQRLTTELQKLGKQVKTTVPYLTLEYWANPINKDREYLNKNPIVDIRNGQIIWKNWQPNQPKPITKSAVRIEKPVSKNKVSSNQELSNYYILNIVGLENNQSQVHQFIKDLGLKNIGTDEWEYVGTTKEFNIIKRSVMGLIDIIEPNNRVSVYGKQIHK